MSDIGKGMLIILVMTYAKVAKQFNVSMMTVKRIITAELKAGNGIKPDRRAKTEPSSDWMQHITPLHKQALELVVEHKQAELDAAKQELRDFTATLRQLMEVDV